MRTTTSSSFSTLEREHQTEFRTSSDTFSAEGRKHGRAGTHEHPFVVPFEHWTENLHPLIRSEALSYFEGKEITWHTMRHHLLSSQICCLNFLMPFATRPAALAQLLKPIFGDVTPLPVEKGEPYVAFEWIGPDCLNEGGRTGKPRKRGANCTSADAAVRFQDGAGRITMALIEWKYTERYGAKPLDKYEEERCRRYAELAFYPHGPIKKSDDLEIADLFWEPFYQFARQQMLAFQLQKTKFDGCDRAVVLHIAPAANVAFQKITAPKLANGTGTAVSAWKSLLTDPSAFISVTTEDMFTSFDQQEHPELGDWWAYVSKRYAGLLGRDQSAGMLLNAGRAK